MGQAARYTSKKSQQKSEVGYIKQDRKLGVS